MDQSKHPKKALTWAPEGRRSRGRPKETWRRTAERERAALGFGTWSEAAAAARDRAAWRGRVGLAIQTGSFESRGNVAVGMDGAWKMLLCLKHGPHIQGNSRKEGTSPILESGRRILGAP